MAKSLSRINAQIDTVKKHISQLEYVIRGSVSEISMTCGNPSFRGAENHAVIMTLAQTAQINNQNPKDALLAIITQNTEKIPSLLFGYSKTDNKSDVPHSSLSTETPTEYALKTVIPP